MIFRRNKPDPIHELSEAIEALKPTPEEELATALRKYEESFAASLVRPDAPDIESAKVTLVKAKRLVSESGLGSALAPTLVEEVQYWPSWSLKEDFESYKHFPATDIYGSRETDEKFRALTKVYFRYKGSQYGLILNDKGYSSFGNDPFHHGTVDFIAEDQVVLGLDVSLNTKYDVSRWDWFDLYAFRPGNWMKVLLEIAAHINAGKERFMDEIENEDALYRARNIEL
jgi:hypothetical protein